MKTKVHRKNYSRSIRNYTFLTIILFLAAIVYGYFQYEKLSTAQTALATGQTQLSKMKTTESQITDQYTALKTNYETNFEDIRDSIEGVFPSYENYTELTKDLDRFVLSLNKKSSSNVPEIFMNNLQFNQPRIDKETDYAVLPFNISLTTTRTNFETFLKFIENSGTIDDGSRLMDVKSISINFPGQSSAGGTSATADNQLNVSLSLNAYYQLPAGIENN